jgi:hypothetical protein
LPQIGAILSWTARFPFAGDDAASQKLVEPGMRFHYCIAGSR